MLQNNEVTCELLLKISLISVIKYVCYLTKLTGMSRSNMVQVHTVPPR